MQDGGMYTCKAVSTYGKTISMAVGRFIVLQGKEKNANLSTAGCSGFWPLVTQPQPEGARMTDSFTVRIHHHFYASLF